MIRALLTTGSAFVLAAWMSSAGAAEKSAPANRVSPENFKHLQQTIRTDYDFRWRCLPWEINPGAAAERAAKEGKPILCFGGHDGVPLGFE